MQKRLLRYAPSITTFAIVKYSLLGALLFVGNLCEGQTPASLVNPFIGTGGHGHTFPGATLPFGMVQLSPDTRIDGSWDGCGGYHFSDTSIYGFSHTHLSGTGVSDYGDILLMPMTGKPVFDKNLYASGFDHATEKASPGYYSVVLKKHNILAEMTTTRRVGMHQYTFAKPGPVSIILDLQHRDELKEFEIRIISKTRVEGFRKSSAWAQNQVVHFVLEFSQPFLKSKFSTSKNQAGFVFLMKNKNPLLAKVAISFSNTAGAAANMQEELPHWNFGEIAENAKNTWNNELQKIQVRSSNNDELVKFYSALYHCMIHPNVASDVNGNYRGMDGEIHRASGYEHYTVFSLWDTYRALHPLLSIIDQKRTLDFIQSFLAMYRDGGRLPVWELAGNETDCMIGYHAVSVITDAWAKGIRGFDSALALEAMISIANENRYGKHAYVQNGFISAELEAESVSKTLEYAYDDWCISVFAEMIGNPKAAEVFKNRSHNWNNLFDPVTGFMRPRYNGNWLQPFDPKEVNNHFTEANCWQYSFYVPQNIHGLMRSLGGSEAMGSKLDKLFAEKGAPSGREQADITGLIGQYAHGNEPSHHMAYLYNYIYMPERTQHLVQSICSNFYTTAPDGLIGNEDCGQMSAWYVLSALGMYQVTPGFPVYTLTSPSVDSARIHLENGNVFQIIAKNRSSNTLFSTPVIDKETTMFLDHSKLKSGGVLVFHMKEIPNENAQDYLLPILPSNDNANPAPPLVAVARSFKGTTNAAIQPVGAVDRIYYFLNSDSMNPIFYTAPFAIDKTSKIHAFSVKENGVETLKSELSTAFCYKTNNQWNIQLNSTYNKQYSAGGENALIDGIRGTANWRAGDWQGYQDTDLEAIIDLGSMQTVNQVSCGFLRDSRSWILMPKKLEIYLSSEGGNYVLAGTISNTIKETDVNTQIQNMLCKISNPRKCRYVKIKAYNYGKLPSWHAGYPLGGTAFIFADEIEIR